MTRGETPSALTLDDERRLLERLKAGDRAAFRAFYDAFSSRLYRAVIYPRLSQEEAAEDVLRDTFLTALEKIHQVRWQERSLYHWLSRIAYNKVIDHHRAHRRTERFVQGFTVHVEASRPGPATPEAEVMGEQQRAQARALAHALLDQLNPRYRRAVELRFFEHRSREDCAEALEVTVGNFDVILFRAIKRLRTLHGRMNDEDA